MGHYRKIDTRVWNDQKFNELSDDAKLVFFLLLTHPYLTSVGAMRASLPGLACELGWSFEKFKKAFDESYLKSMIRFDELSSLIWLPNFLKYNQPESPNVIKSWGHSIDYLPECSLKDLLVKHIQSYVLKLTPAFQEALPEVFRKGMPNQEQEQEHKHKQEKNIMSGKPDDVSFKIDNYLKNQTSLMREQAIEVLKFLCEKTGRAYRINDTNINLVLSRLKTGATLMDCRKIIAKKFRDWKDNPKMNLYLRPETLFSPKKFESYIAELVAPVSKENAYDNK